MSLVIRCSLRLHVARRYPTCGCCVDNTPDMLITFSSSDSFERIVLAAI